MHASSLRKSGIFKSGFTLIELLITIAILASLISMLSISLARAKSKARMTHCLSNLRQLQLSYLTYTTDFYGALPNNLTSPGKSGIWRSATNSWCGPSNATLQNDHENLKVGSLFPYHSALKLYRCPGDDSSTVTVLPNASPAYRSRSYSINSALYGRGIGPNRIVIRTVSASRNPARTFTFVDEDEDTIDDGHFFPGSNIPAYRHDESTSLAFLDGHVAKSGRAERLDLDATGLP